MTAFADIVAFVQQYPDGCDHVVDLPYRLCSPSAQDEQNVRVWKDAAGCVMGFGVIQLQFANVDYAAAPGHADLIPQIIDWALARLQTIRAERGEDLGFLLGSRSLNDPAILATGFEDDGWSYRHLAMPLTADLEQPVVPEGIRFRPLKGESEVEAYVALHRAAFDSRNMSVEWRSRTVAHPAYQPAVDLVAEDEAGQLVAFCIGWISDVQGVKTGQIEPLGVMPDVQGKGIGRAILLTNLQKMRELGCTAARIDAESTNPASNALYEGVGYVEFARTHQYFKWF